VADDAAWRQATTVPASCAHADACTSSWPTRTSASSTAAGNANLTTPELVDVIAEHAMGNHRVAVWSAAELMAAAEQHDRDTLDEALYLEVFGGRGASRAKRRA